MKASMFGLAILIGLSQTGCFLGTHSPTGTTTVTSGVYDAGSDGRVPRREPRAVELNDVSQDAR